MNEKYDLSLFLQGKEANVLKNPERERAWMKKEDSNGSHSSSKDGQVQNIKSDQFATLQFRSRCFQLINTNELSKQY